MSIIGLTDNLDGKLPVIARLYKGDPKPDAFRPGKDLSYFRIEFEERYEEYRPVWEEMYGAEPTSFENVYLVGKTVSEAFPSWKELWDAKAMLHRCDGKTQVMWHNSVTMQYEHVPVACAQTCGCKPTGTLSLFFFDFFAATGVLGCVAFSTHSVNDILQLHRYLSFLQSKNFALDSIPFEIGRSEKKISARIEDKNGDAKRMRVNKSLLWIHVEPDFMRDYVLPAMQRVNMLPAAAPQPAALPNGIPEIIEAETVEDDTRELPTVDVAEARKALGGGSGDRRMGNDKPAASAPETPVAVPAVEGVKRWSMAEASEWANDKLANGHGPLTLKKALGIMSGGQWTDFKGDTAAANAMFGEWLNAQIEGVGK